MNIGFEEISYNVEKRKLWQKRGEDNCDDAQAHVFHVMNFIFADVKQILHEISGEFRSYELSGIIGPSGSGKSSLLNILSGYISNNISGNLKVNQNVVSQKTIRLKSSYIMQENKLHEFLTVYETMSFAMNLKVGKRMSNESKSWKVRFYSLKSKSERI
jgi:ABC-type multidrug transport system ATPase subunit